MSVSIQERTEAFQAAATKQPGCTPYDNHRPVFIRKRSAGQSLSSLLKQFPTYRDAPELMSSHLDKGWLLIDDKRPRLNQPLVAGNIVKLVIPNMVEPPIATGLVVHYEDDHILVVSKPAPLPVHPCGRFNRNSVVIITRTAWPDIRIKPVHRLDANTTGLLVFAKTAQAAGFLINEFTAQRVKKVYMARVHGTPDVSRTSIDMPIQQAPSIGGTREIHTQGRAARTDFELCKTLKDGTALLCVRPHTGRTNQIRLHLQNAGLPIVGDVAYGHQPEVHHGLTQPSLRLYLHAHQLTFRHPEHRTTMDFESPIPDDFTACIRPR